MNIIHNTLGGLELGAPVAHRNLAVVPLLLADGVEVSDPGYLVLDEALEAKRCRVTEVSEGGSVPELLFVNEADRPILLLDGEELVGAKQNRVLNVTLAGRRQTGAADPGVLRGAGPLVLAQPGFRLGEAGHVRERAAGEDGAGVHEPAQPGQPAGGPGRGLGQRGEPIRWRFPSVRPRVRWPTSTRTRPSALDEMRRGFSSQPRQVGAVFFVAGEVAGLELFDAPSTFAALSAKLIDSYAMDALASRSDSAEPPGA